MHSSNGKIMEKESVESEDRKPHFFKIIHGEEIKQHLRIPPAFLKHLEGEESETVTLQGPSGGHWQVAVSKNANGMYFEDGWNQFVRNNNLGNNEFLVLRYDGNLHFHVKIFAENGVKKRSSPFPDTKTQAKRLSLAKRSGQFSTGKRGRGRPRKYPISPLNRCQTESCEDDHGGNSRVRKTTGSFTSKFPFFVCCMTRSCVEKSFILTLPYPFSIEHFPAQKFTVVLRNSEGKAWDVICIYHAKRHSLSGGWCAFVRANGIKQGDVCIFEVVDKTVMQVHVL